MENCALCRCRPNPYHNSRHAADVLQTLHMILTSGGLMPGYADQLTLLGCYLAAVVHDFEHVGRSNDYLVNTHDTLAIRYNGGLIRAAVHMSSRDAFIVVTRKHCQACIRRAKVVLCVLQTSHPWRTTTLLLPGSCLGSPSTAAWPA